MSKDIKENVFIINKQRKSQQEKKDSQKKKETEPNGNSETKKYYIKI